MLCTMTFWRSRGFPEVVFESSYIGMERLKDNLNRVNVEGKIVASRRDKRTIVLLASGFWSGFVSSLRRVQRSAERLRNPDRFNRRRHAEAAG